MPDGLNGPRDRRGVGGVWWKHRREHVVFMDTRGQGAALGRPMTVVESSASKLVRRRGARGGGEVLFVWLVGLFFFFF